MKMAAAPGVGPRGVGNKVDAAARSMAAPFWSLAPEYCTDS